MSKMRDLLKLLGWKRIAVGFCLLIVEISGSLVLSNSAGCCSQADRSLVQQQWNAVWRKADSSDFKQGFASALLQRLVIALCQKMIMFRETQNFRVAVYGSEQNCHI
jgi:hypothetical protein